MSVSVRFAPSPTGRLHIGNIRTALLNWMLARQSGGNFLLRFDDTDTERSKQEYVDAIREDLTWLGLTWDREARQSERTARYDEVAAAWKAAGLLYACYETADELDRKRRRQLARGLPPIYDRAGLRLTAEDHQAAASEGRAPHWRFRLPNTGDDRDGSPQPTLVHWDDLCRGEQTVDLGSLSDPVLIREDGSYLYTFTSPIDDADMEITHVLRGADHITNTGVQAALFDALNAPLPKFGHHNLLVAADGSALSKRLGALSIEGLRQDGLEPRTLTSHAALIGTSDPVEPFTDLGQLAKRFDPAKISPAPTKFDAEDLVILNAKLLHITPFEDVAARLDVMGIAGGPAFWDAVRGNLDRIGDAATWWQIVNGRIAPVIEDEAVTASAARQLPEEPWDGDMWSTWTKAIKTETGAKGRGLFQPLRLAITGLGAGPELAPLLPLIGRERLLQRLCGIEA